MRVIPSRGDGNCLFHSLSYFLEIDHVELRRQVYLLMRDYPELKINGVSIEQWLKIGDYGTEYKKMLARNGTWGSALEIAIVSIIFRRTIEVYDSKFKRIAEFNPKYGSVIKIRWNGGHYDSLI